MEPGSEKVNIELCVRGDVGYKSIHQWKIEALDGYLGRTAHVVQVHESDQHGQRVRHLGAYLYNVLLQ